MYNIHALYMHARRNPSGVERVLITSDLLKSMV